MIEVGQTFAGHRIEAVIGRGGMGVVYRAMHETLERTVALKVITPELSRDPEFRRRFVDESKIAASLEHPHVVPVFHAGEESGQLYTTMRLLEGPDLREVIARDGRVAPERAVRLIAQVASALDAAHERGLVHRDVKPANVVVVPDESAEHAYLTDFGLSKSVAGSGPTATAGFVGTLHYIAPEQLRGEAIDRRVDVYALACTLFHALAGRVPFDRPSEAAVMFAHLSDPPPSLLSEGVDAGWALDTVVGRGMSKQPENRYETAGAFGRAALEAVTTGVVPPPPPPDPKRKPKAPVSRVRVREDEIVFGDEVRVIFHRTLRIPDDGRDYPLPASLGAFPVRRVDDHADRVPEGWREHGGVFIPMYQREAMWISFQVPSHKPRAFKVAVGKVNALTGKPWSNDLDGAEQDYLVSPPQPWLDGIAVGDGRIRQFVAMPLGMGYTVEGQVTGEEVFGGLQIIAFDPKPGRFPDEPPEFRERFRFAPAAPAPMAAPAAGGAAGEMGLGAGGRMRQEIHDDPHGVDTWDQETFGRIYVHIVNSLMYEEITGETPPPTPITREAYKRAGFKWYRLYEEEQRKTHGGVLGRIKSIRAKDAEKGFGPQQDDSPIEVSPDEVVGIGEDADPDRVRDGDW